MEEEAKGPEKTGAIRDEQGKFVEGVSGNPEGRPRETLERKLIKRASKEFIADYKEKLAEVLPEISDVLIKKAKEGDMRAIKEIHDIIIEKPKQLTDIHFPLIDFKSDREEFS